MAKAVYKSKDGEDHATEAEAERRDTLVDASKDLEAAAKRVAVCMAERAQTADGKPFDMRKSRIYWLVRRSWGDLPRLEEVYLYPHWMEVDLEYPSGRVLLRKFEQRDRGGSEYIRYDIRELYADERKAKAALVEACEEYVAELQEKLDALRAAD